MIDVKEARNIAHNKHIREQFAKIEDTIVNAANNGEFYCLINEYIYEEIKERLKNLGYTIKDDIYYEQVVITFIGWGA